MNRLNRKAPLVMLFLVLAVGLVLVGVSQGTKNEADALPVIPSYVKGLFASNFSPADGDSEVALDKTITVEFNLDLKSATIQDGSNFYIKKAGGIFHLPATITYYSFSDKAYLNPSSDLLPDTTYYVTLTDDVESSTGLHLVNDQTWSFTTVSPPEVVSKTPAANAVDVPVTQSVAVTFDKTMDWSTVTSSSFYIQRVGSGNVAGSLLKSIDKKSATILPYGDLKEGATYIVTITTAVEAENGLALETPVTWMFTTAADAPQVTTKVPAPTATGVPVDQIVSATFDSDMDASTITAATFYLKKTGGSPLVATVAYDAGTRTATLDPAAVLEEGTTYEVTLTTAVEGDNGAPLASAVVWTFTTAGEAPAVTSHVPADGSTEVPVGQVVSATFDKDIKASTLTSATFYIKKSGGSPLPASVAYSGGTRTATLEPSSDLEAGETYEVTLTTAVEGENNVPLASAVVWTFTTAGGGGAPFSDVAGSPYETAIYELADRGIVTGFEDMTFRPNSMVTRQQFAKMIVLTLGFTVTGMEICPFTDVVAQTGTDPFYPSKYVAVCAEQGIAKGKTATTYAPYEYITHQQLFTMIARAAGLSDPPPGYVASFTADQFYTTEHYQNAVKCEAAGLLDGLVGIGPSYNFAAGSTRGECAQVLYNLIGYMGL